MEEMNNFKKGVKAVLEQFTYEIKDHLKELGEDFKKQNIQTTNAINVLANKVMRFQEGPNKGPPSPPSSSKPSPSVQVVYFR